MMASSDFGASAGLALMLAICLSPMPQEVFGQAEAPPALFDPAWKSGTVDLSYADKSITMLSHAQHGVTHYPNLGKAKTTWNFKMGDCKAAKFWCDDVSLDRGDQLVTGNAKDGYARGYHKAGETYLFLQDFYVSFTSRWSAGTADPALHGLKCFATCVDFTSRSLSSEISTPADLAVCSTLNDGDGLFFTSHESVTKKLYPNGRGDSEYNFDASSCPSGEGILKCDFLNLARNGDACRDNLAIDGTTVDDNNAVVPVTWAFTGRTSVCYLPPGGFHDPHLDTEFVGRINVTFNEGRHRGAKKSRRGFICAAECRDSSVPSCNHLTVSVLGHDYRPAEGAKVSVTNGSSETVTTGKEGLAHFYITNALVGANGVKLNVLDPSEEHYDISDYPVTLDSDGRTSMEVTLTRVVRVFLEVVSARDDKTPNNLVVDAWETHGVHCPNHQCSYKHLSGGWISFYFPAGPPYLTVEVRHDSHRSMDFGVIVPDGANNVTLECPIVLAPTEDVTVTLKIQTFKAGGYVPVPRANVAVDDNHVGKTDRKGEIVLSLHSPSSASGAFQYDLKICDDARTLCQRRTYKVVSGMAGSSRSPTIELDEVVSLNFTVSGSYQSGPAKKLSGVPLRILPSPVWLIEGPKTGADGTAVFKALLSTGGGAYVADVIGGGIPGYTQTPGGYSFFHSAGETQLDVPIDLLGTCNPSWDGTQVKSLQFTSMIGPDSRQLRLTQKKTLPVASECTQPDKVCDASLTSVQRISASSPLTDLATLHSNFNGTVFVSVRESGNTPIVDWGGSVELLDVSSNKLVDVPMHSAAPFPGLREWSVGCVDMETMKFYCINVIGLGDVCDQAIPK